MKRTTLRTSEQTNCTRSLEMISWLLDERNCGESFQPDATHITPSSCPRPMALPWVRQLWHAPSPGDVGSSISAAGNGNRPFHTTYHLPFRWPNQSRAAFRATNDTGRDVALTVKRIPVNEYIAQTRDVVPMSEHIPSSLRCFNASTLQNNDNAPHDEDGRWR